MTDPIAPIVTTTTWEGRPDPETAKQKRGAYHYWKGQAEVRQRIIDKQNKTIADLTASVVSLENDVSRLETDYDTVEAELKALQAKKARPPQRVLIL